MNKLREKLRKRSKMKISLSEKCLGVNVSEQAPLHQGGAWAMSKTWQQIQRTLWVVFIVKA